MALSPGRPVGLMGQSTGHDLSSSVDNSNIHDSHHAHRFVDLVWRVSVGKRKIRYWSSKLQPASRPNHKDSSRIQSLPAYVILLLLTPIYLQQLKHMHHMIHTTKNSRGRRRAEKEPKTSHLILIVPRPGLFTPYISGKHP